MKDRLPLGKDMLDLIETALLDAQSGGGGLDTLIDKDWLKEEGNEGAFMLYYFPQDFIGPFGEPAWEPWNDVFIQHLEQNREAMSLLPGGGGKSTTLLRYMVLLMCREPQISIIYIEKTGPAADIRAQALATMLEGNKRLIEHYGVFKGDKQWSTKAMTIRQRPEIIQWPTISFFGAGGQGGLGSRCNVLIADDPVTQDNSTSELERSRLWVWWTLAATTCPAPLKVSYKKYLKRLSLSGTKFHKGDLYHMAEEKMPNMKTLHIKAVDEGGTTFSNRFHYEDPEDLKIRAATQEDAAILVKLIDDGAVTNLWDYKKTSVVAFNLRMQNVVSNPDTQIFPEVWFDGGEDDMSPPGGYPGCKDSHLSLGEERKQGWKYVTGIDPASGAHTSNTVRFASVTLGWDPENPQYTYLVDLEYGKHPLESDSPTRKTQTNIVLSQVEQYGSRIVLETNNIQGVYDGVLRKAAKAKGMSLLVSAHKTSKEKKLDEQMGIEAMAQMVESGALRLPWKTRPDQKKVRELITEMVDYGVNTTDDILMALWFAWRQVERYRKNKGPKQVDTTHVPAYMIQKVNYDFPKHWTEQQKMAFLGIVPEEEEEAVA